jgi:hypothetical protein
MKGIKKIKLQFKMIAVLLLLINGLCTAAPAIQAYAFNEESSTGIFANPNSNTIQTEEEQILASVYPTKRNMKAGKIISFLSSPSLPYNNFTLDSESENSYISFSSLLPSPGYYTFLFRYNLF